MTASVIELEKNLREVRSFTITEKEEEALVLRDCTTFVSSSFSYPPAHCLFLAEEGVVGAPADAAGGEEEPVHEDPGAVVVGVIRHQPVPLVLLLTRTVPPTPRCGLLAAQT